MSLVEWDNQNKKIIFDLERYILVGINIYNSITLETESYIYGVPRSLFKDNTELKEWIKEYDYISLGDEIELPLTMTVMGDSVTIYEKGNIIPIRWTNELDDNNNYEFLIGKYIYGYGRFIKDKFKMKFIDNYSKDVHTLYNNLILELSTRR